MAKVVLLILHLKSYLIYSVLDRAGKLQAYAIEAGPTPVNLRGPEYRSEHIFVFRQTKAMGTPLRG